MKVIVIGINHAGTTAVRTLKRLNKKIEVVAYDKNDVISFLGCGIALWVKGEVTNPENLFYASPDILKSEGIDVKMKHEWIGIDASKKIITVKNLENNQVIEDSYDKLIVATGSWPIIPPIPGINLKGVQICKNYAHGDLISKANNDENVKHVAIVGAGYIGVELVDAFVAKGKKVTLVDLADRIMPNYYDVEFTDLVKNKMIESGVDIQLGSKVIAFEGTNGSVNKVVTDKGEIKTDYVIFSVGVEPQTNLLKGLVELTPNKAVKTNDFMQSSNEDIYAIGDCASVFNKSMETNLPIQLATTAVRTGILAAVNVVTGNSLPSIMGFTGANGIDVFGIKMASCGVTKAMAEKINLDVEEKIFTDNDRPEFMSTQSNVLIKIIWNRSNRKIIGAQVASENNHTETMYMFSLAIQKELTIDELPLVDIFFLPHFNKPYNFITLAGLDVLGLNYFRKQ